ncbi:phosphoglucosamine mutase [Chondrinema litorale]|uniref:phosphoglucosamine mutase n=1 Tax=Chondrinema litorale TaxID=2994555 RepID=UPI0025433708|nr:phosphoglucosamine mutase [Chondrinema litorale]UZR92937.1 phosphoglucosamine mutase [Chondrinema litorale]
MTLIKSISGIRGTIGGKPGENLSPLDVVKYAAAYAYWIKSENENAKVVIGRDARISGEMIADLVKSTLIGMGCDIIDLGLSTTPTVEVMVTEEKAAGGIIITASHNPAQWNALKLLNNKGEFISDEIGRSILEIADKNEFDFATINHLGNIRFKDDAIEEHIEMITKLPLVDVDAIKSKNFNVIIDCVNSTGGIALPKLLSTLGVENVTELYCEPNGKFPHNPEPLPENITEICSKIENGNFHLGIVVDPDVDRLMFICEDGTPFGEEYTLVSIADYVLQHKKGSTVSNLSSTRALKDVTLNNECKHFEAAVGEVNVVNKMKEVGAVIGGEGNGGVIYPDLHYGRDALVGIALFLSHLAKFAGSAKMLRRTYPDYTISKNKIELNPTIDVDKILAEIQARYQNNEINTIDGVKIYFDKEWVQLRKSNTEPIIRIYAEADSPSKADNLAKKIISDIKEIL